MDPNPPTSPLTPPPTPSPPSPPPTPMSLSPPTSPLCPWHPPVLSAPAPGTPEAQEPLFLAPSLSLPLALLPPLMTYNRTLDFNDWMKILPIVIPTWDSDTKWRRLLRPSLVLASPTVHQLWPLQSASICRNNFHHPSAIRFFFCQSSLRSLTVCNCTLDEACTSPLSRLTRLQKLSLTSCPIATFNLASNLAPLLQLRTLVVNKCQNMDMGFGPALTCLSSLQHLEWCYSSSSSFTSSMANSTFGVVAGAVTGSTAGGGKEAVVVSSTAGGVMTGTVAAIASNTAAGGVGGKVAVVASSAAGAGMGGTAPGVMSGAAGGTTSRTASGTNCITAGGSMGGIVAGVTSVSAGGACHRPGSSCTYVNTHLSEYPGSCSGPWSIPGQQLTQLKLAQHKFGSRGESDCLSRLTALHTLCLSYCTALTSQELQSLATLPSLQDLTFDSCQAMCPMLFCHLVPLTQLSRLRLVRYDRLDMLDLHDMAMLMCLAELELTLCNTDTAAAMRHISRLRRLKVLNLSYSDDVSAEGLKHLLGLPQLKHLDLSNCSGVDAKALYYISLLSSLQELYLSYCWGIGVQGLRHLSRLHPSLHTLDIGGFWPEEDAEAQLALQHITVLSSLQVLDLSFCFERLDPAALGLLSHLKHLTELDLSETHWLDTPCLQQLAHVSSLRSLNLSGCAGVDIDGIRHIASMPLLSKLMLDCCPLLVSPYVAWPGRDLPGSPVCPQQGADRSLEVLAMFPDSCRVEF